MGNLLINLDGKPTSTYSVPYLILLLLHAVFLEDFMSPNQFMLPDSHVPHTFQDNFKPRIFKDSDNTAGVFNVS